MPRVVTQDKEAVLIDRGSTLLLAAIEVGPHIKALRAETGLPHAFIDNASYYLRRADIWKRRSVHYSWLSPYRQGLPEGIEGLTNDAQVAAGLSGPDVPFHRLVDTGRRHNKGWQHWDSVEPPACGTSVALGRHRRAGESCDTCEAAAVERHQDWLHRKKRIQKQRAEYARQREQLEAISLDEWEDLLEGEREKRTSVWTNISMDAPLLWGNDGERMTLHDRVPGDTAVSGRHNIEWRDPTFEVAEPELTDWLYQKRLEESA